MGLVRIIGRSHGRGLGWSGEVRGTFVKERERRGWRSEGRRSSAIVWSGLEYSLCLCHVACDPVCARCVDSGPSGCTSCASAKLANGTCTTSCPLPHQQPNPDMDMLCQCTGLYSGSTCQGMRMCVYICIIIVSVSVYVYACLWSLVCVCVCVCLLFVCV